MYNKLEPMQKVIERGEITIDIASIQMKLGTWIQLHFGQETFEAIYRENGIVEFYRTSNLPEKVKLFGD